MMDLLIRCPLFSSGATKAPNLWICWKGEGMIECQSVPQSVLAEEIMKTFPNMQLWVFCR
jgi:hypothetical protein